MGAIFKRDFRAFFTSMTGFVFLGVFLLIMNIFFSLGNIMDSRSSVAGVFSTMMFINLFTIPLLTMRSFAEDFKQKTDQLLFTAPIRPISVVLGKFLAAFAVYALALVAALLWVLIIAVYGAPNGAEVAGNYLAMLLVGGVYISIGVFISSLTENQLIAAVSSYGVFFLLYILDMLKNGFSSMPAWITSVLYFISITGRHDTITAGLIALDDIIFFLSAAALFLFFCHRILERKRRA
ncbi:MAG: ABC transporter permease [Oscillospiraceae bacterium]|jgi:ABC-2 type transport system permease protein|nr:ABC transporter permease [Oscillospiraceae bacterium]